MNATLQFELFAALLVVCALVLIPPTIYYTRRRNRAVKAQALLLALLLSLGVASIAWTQEPGKPTPPVMNAWCRLKVEWVGFTHSVREFWQELCARIEWQHGKVIAADAYTITRAAAIPVVNTPTVIQLHHSPLSNSANQNFKAQVESLHISDDGVVTVTVRNSRSVDNAPEMQMYLHDGRTGKIYWVDHLTTSYPETAGDPNSYTYTFSLPVSITAGLRASQSVE